MKIAFQTYGGGDWQGGVTFLTSVLQALRALDDQTLELALVIWEGTEEVRYQAVLPWVDLKLPTPQAPPPEGELAYLASLRTHLAWWLTTKIRGAPSATARRFQSDVLRQNGMDCTFSMPLERRPDFGVPLIVWVPDLQHLHLPGLISAPERENRNRLYRKEAEEADILWATSEAVRSDVEVLSPGRGAKVRVLQPVVPIPSGLYAQDPAALAAHYHLPEKFFLLPNQYWQHKNHALVIEALELLRARSVFPTVVCAGHTVDPRNPLHFGELLNRAAAAGVHEQFILLGLLPHEHVLRLMRQAVCVLNPSLFEGFGFSLAESAQLGKRALVSDLPAHREQAAPAAMYFDPQDAAALADCLEQIWRAARPGPDAALEAAARAEFPARQRAFAQAFLGLAREAQALRVR